jgi:hypothetical protein
MFKEKMYLDSGKLCFRLVAERGQNRVRTNDEYSGFVSFHECKNKKIKI